MIDKTRAEVRKYIRADTTDPYYQLEDKDKNGQIASTASSTRRPSGQKSGRSGGAGGVGFGSGSKRILFAKDQPNNTTAATHEKTTTLFRRSNRNLSIRQPKQSDKSLLPPVLPNK